MIETVFSEWRPGNAHLVRASLDNASRPVVVEDAVQHAIKSLPIENPDGSGYLVPLFAEGGPAPSDEYVIYRPSSGSVGWFDTEFGISGAKRFVEPAELARSTIGQRLRFWLPENRPEPALDIDDEDLPAETVEPTARLDDATVRGFFDELQSTVASERAAERDAAWESYTEMGLSKAITRGRAVGPFLYVSRGRERDGGDGFRFQLAVEDDDTRVDLRDEGIFPGNRCIIDVESDGPFPIEAQVVAVDGPGVSLRPDWETVADRGIVEKTLLLDDIDVWIHELLNPVPFDRRSDALAAVHATPSKRDLLTGRRSVSFAVNRYTPPESILELNEYQQRALIWAASAEDVVCIHGPPGTGKTRTLTAYVQYAVDQGQSVLVTAHSNQAVDNLLVGDSTLDEPEEGTLHAMARDPDVDLSIARAGSNSTNRVVNAEYADAAVGSADVVAATTSGAAAFDMDAFDVAVVDEATQASRPATAIALNCARKLVLAGDHKQLSPYSATEPDTDTDAEPSLFEALLERYGDGIAVVLQRQYRMHEAIAAFPNETFYDGLLETADRNREWTIADLEPVVGIDVNGTEQRSRGHSYENPAEAEAVAKQVQLLTKHDVAPADIGAIAAYSGQERRIRSRLTQLDIENVDEVDVHTVDSFQGGEREAIIVSFVRSNDEGWSGFLEFPEEGKRRLNVALTRARKRLVFVGNWETLTTRSPNRERDESCANVYAALAAHLRSENRMLSQRST